MAYKNKNLAISLSFSLASIASAATAEDVNNGTNPAALATTVETRYKHTELGNGSSAGLFEALYTRPFNNNTMSWTLTLPYASGVTDSSFGLGDFGAGFTHVAYTTDNFAFAYEAELFFDTADRPELGRGQTVAKLSAYFLNFSEKGTIIAPALVHEVGLGDEDAGRQKVNTTTFDLYYVPKLANPRYFVTFDPALVHDWEDDATFGSLSVTLGMVTGKVWGGNAVAYVEPQILAGSDRPADWSLQVGFKVIGF